MRRTCYGILMLLPQSDAFKTLATRLHSVPVHALQQLDPSSRHSGQPGQASLDQGALISTFRRCQASGGRLHGSRHTPLQAMPGSLKVSACYSAGVCPPAPEQGQGDVVWHLHFACWAGRQVINSCWQHLAVSWSTEILPGTSEPA